MHWAEHGEDDEMQGVSICVEKYGGQLEGNVKLPQRKEQLGGGGGGGGGGGPRVEGRARFQP